MCLAVPAKVLSLDETTDMAVVELLGVQKEISTVLVEDVQIGDYVLIHVGYALQKISEDDAAETLALFDDLKTQNENEDTLGIQS